MDTQEDGDRMYKKIESEKEARKGKIKWQMRRKAFYERGNKMKKERKD